MIVAGFLLYYNLICLPSRLCSSSRFFSFLATASSHEARELIVSCLKKPALGGHGRYVLCNKGMVGL
eukprot:COSAG05_NODE_724_length_7726_cov_2.123771_1_plen_67_part_00